MSDTASHVLIFIPPYLLEEGHDGFWDLQTFAAYESGDPADDYDIPDTPDVADPGPWLADWVSGQLGYPVTLIPDVQRIRTRRWSRWHAEPIYYVEAATP